MVKHTNNTAAYQAWSDIRFDREAMKNDYGEDPKVMLRRWAYKFYPGRDGETLMTDAYLDMKDNGYIRLIFERPYSRVSQAIMRKDLGLPPEPPLYTEERGPTIYVDPKQLEPLPNVVAYLYLRKHIWKYFRAIREKEKAARLVKEADDEERMIQDAEDYAKKLPQLRKNEVKKSLIGMYIRTPKMTQAQVDEIQGIFDDEIDYQASLIGKPRLYTGRSPYRPPEVSAPKVNRTVGREYLIDPRMDIVEESKLDLAEDSEITKGELANMMAEDKLSAAAALYALAQAPPRAEPPRKNLLKLKRPSQKPIVRVNKVHRFDPENRILEAANEAYTEAMSSVPDTVHGLKTYDDIHDRFEKQVVSDPAYQFLKKTGVAKSSKHWNTYKEHWDKTSESIRRAAEKYKQKNAKDDRLQTALRIAEEKRRQATDDLLYKLKREIRADEERLAQDEIRQMMREDYLDAFGEDRAKAERFRDLQRAQREKVTFKTKLKGGPKRGPEQLFLKRKDVPMDEDFIAGGPKKMQARMTEEAIIADEINRAADAVERAAEAAERELENAAVRIAEERVNQGVKLEEAVEEVAAAAAEVIPSRQSIFNLFTNVTGYGTPSRTQYITQEDAGDWIPANKFDPAGWTPANKLPEGYIDGEDF